jgi:hypothetical protein
VVTEVIMAVGDVYSKTEGEYERRALVKHIVDEVERCY